MTQEEFFNTLFPRMNEDEQTRVLNEISEEANDEAMINALEDPIRNFK
jgi:hypothetical protein